MTNTLNFYSDSNFDLVDSISSTIKESNQSLDKAIAKSNFNFTKFLSIGIATLVLQFSVANLEMQQSQSDLSSNKTLFSFLNKSLNNNQSPFSNSGIISKSLHQNNPIAKLQEITQQKIQQKIIDSPYMQSLFNNKEDAFINLLNTAEGKRNNFYRDNKGIAIAYGWNPTRNSIDFNLDIAKKAGLSEEQTAAILKVSDNQKIKFVPKELKSISLSDEQLNQTAIALMPKYEEQFLTALSTHAINNNKDPKSYIDNYNMLPFNQQAVLIHMAYKVGGDNLLKYKSFYKSLFNYLDNPTKNNLAKVEKNFSYTYQKDGETLHDEMVEKFHSEFFQSCSVSQNSSIKSIKAKIQECRVVANIKNDNTSSLRII